MTIEGLLDAFTNSVAATDWERAGRLLADGFFDHVPGEGEPTAPERIIPLIADLASAVPDLALRFDGLTGEGPEHQATFSLSGTHLGPLWGAPPTGAAVEWSNPITLRTDAGKLAFRFDDVAFPELVAALRQFGLINPADLMAEPPPYPVSVPEFVLKVVMTGQAGDRDCSHLSDIRVTEPTTRVCAACVAEGTNWPALRMCLSCGHVGCCDTSRNKHAKAHAEEAGHPLMRSILMDESWAWCYVDDAFFEGRLLAGLAGRHG